MPQAGWVEHYTVVAHPGPYAHIDFWLTVDGDFTGFALGINLEDIPSYSVILKSEYVLLIWEDHTVLCVAGYNSV